MRTSHKHILCMHATDSRLACFGAGGLVVLVLNVTCRMQYCLSEWMSEREMTLQHTNAAAETAHRRKKKQTNTWSTHYCTVMSLTSFPPFSQSSPERHCFTSLTTAAYLSPSPLSLSLCESSSLVFPPALHLLPSQQLNSLLLLEKYRVSSLGRNLDVTVRDICR